MGTRADNRTRRRIQRARRRRARTTGGARRWFGVIPRWVGWGVLVGGVLAYLLFGVAPAVLGPSPQVLAVINGLRYTSVYVAPGAPSVVDAARARQVIGDRPIVVALLDRTPLPDSGHGLERQDLCQDIADETPTNIVLLYAAKHDGDYDSSICVGPDFANVDYPVNADDFDLPLIVQAETAWKYRATDTNLTPQIEEFVLAFDLQAAQSYPTEVPRRAVVKPPPPLPSPLQAGQIVLAIGGLIVAVVAVFALLKLLGHWYSRGRDRRSTHQLADEQLSARLSSLAGGVLHQDTPSDAADATRQAETARRYVLVLQRFELYGATPEVKNEVAELEELVSS